MVSPHASDDEIADEIAAWHVSDSPLELHEWLGWTREQYSAWVESGQISPPAIPMMKEPKLVVDIVGNCPMGCGETLYVDDDGSILCSSGSCKQPQAVDMLLSETGEHFVTIQNETALTIHPLAERITGLASCELHAWINSDDAPDLADGDYIAVRDEDGSWQMIPQG